MKANPNTALLPCDHDDDPEFAKALEEAIRNPERREELISFLETIGLLPSDPESHA